MRRTEVERIAERDVAVDDLDRLDLDRTVWPGSILFARLAPDQGAQVPPPIGHPASEDDRAGEAHAADHHAALNQFPDAVGEGDFVDVDQCLAITAVRDLSELETAEQRSFKASDAERGG